MQKVRKELQAELPCRCYPMHTIQIEKEHAQGFIFSIWLISLIDFLKWIGYVWIG